MMRKDAERVLNFMASNGLVANENKTGFMTLNDKTQSNPTNKIMVGESPLTQSRSTRLLGIQVQDTQKWSEHINEIIKSLNMRFLQIRRIINHFPKKHILKVVHSLWFSKVRYGVLLVS